MLNVDGLKDNIKQMIQDIVIPAIKEIELARQPIKSDQGEKMAEQIANTFDELVSEPLADNLANAIDYYIKNMAITGTIITVGSPVTQTAVITSQPTPVVNGKVPNTLGIS
jgi:CHASE3 domain sensor protein